MPIKVIKALILLIVPFLFVVLLQPAEAAESSSVATALPQIAAGDNHSRSTDGTVWSFNTGTAESHFTSCVSHTGNNATMMVPTTVALAPPGFSFAPGDEIAVFLPDGSLCVGLGIWNGSNLAITVWGDNLQTPEKDGIASGEEMIIWIWDQSEDVEHTSVAATYSQGNGIYTADSLHVLGSLTFSDAGSPFDCVSLTGNNATVLVPADIQILGGIPLEPGDEIAVFNPAGTVCAGLITWQGVNEPITVWGDNQQTAEVDGMVAGEEMIIWIWDQSEDVEHTSVATTYSQGNGIYAVDSLHVLSSLTLSDAGPPFDCVSLTGNNATVLVPVDIQILGGLTLESGDEIAVFNPAGTVCAGLITWQGENEPITVWGDNQQTAELDGMVAGEAMGYQVWDESLDVVHTEVSVTYRQGNGIYNVDSLHVLDTMNFDPSVVQHIDLLIGWNMISSSVIPENPNMSDVFQPIIDDLILVKNGNGQVFWPDQAINDIGDWNVKEAYKVYVTAPVTLSITGTKMDGKMPINLPAGWSTITYPWDTPMPIEDALCSIMPDLLLVKDGYGRVYWPEYGINQIDLMEPGKGYQIYLSGPATLVFLDPGETCYYIPVSVGNMPAR